MKKCELDESEIFWALHCVKFGLQHLACVGDARSNVEAVIALSIKLEKAYYGEIDQKDAVARAYNAFMMLEEKKE